MNEVDKSLFIFEDETTFNNEKSTTLQVLKPLKVLSGRGIVNIFFFKTQLKQLYVASVKILYLLY